MSNCAAGFSPFSTLADLTYCQYYECCGPNWIYTNITALSQKIQSKLYGQPLVSKILIKHFSARMAMTPPKALSLSFHGGTGTGKTLVSKMIAESIFKRGMGSKYVHLISSTKDIAYKRTLIQYKNALKERIENGVKQCPQSLFIFDEIDKTLPGVLDIVTPYIDYLDHLDGIDYRYSIFIFLSNTGGVDILKQSLAHTNIGLKEMERIISKSALKTKGSGFYDSAIISKHLITSFVPFNPLEKKHVRECIKDVLLTRYFKEFNARKNIPEELVIKIAAELNYFPEDTGLFSMTGCKRVPEKVDYVMIDYTDI